MRLLGRILLVMMTAVFFTATGIITEKDNETELENEIYLDYVKKSMDTIILLDTSGSMRGSDRERIAIDAIKLYIDLIGISGARIGIIAFNDKITKIIGLREIEGDESRESIKAEIDSLAYDGYTDIGMSLAYGAYEMAKHIDDTSRPLFILFTDGKIEIDERNSGGRTPADSYNEIQNVLNHAAGLIPIYTVGLNYNDTVDEPLLQSISARTGARSYITDSAANLPRIFYEIFADFIKSSLIDIGTFAFSDTDIPIDIPNKIVAEASIILLSSAAVSDIRLSDPTGNVKEIPSSDTSYSTSGKYTMIKLQNPMQGKWSLSVPGSGGSLNISLICNYKDLELVMDIERSDDSDRINISGRLVNNGMFLSDSEIYHDLSGTIIIESGSDRYELTMKNIGDRFTGTVPEAIIDGYESGVMIYIKVLGNDYSRDSEKTRLMPRIIATPEPTLTPTQEPTPTAISTFSPAPEQTSEPYTDASPAFQQSLFVAAITAFLTVLGGALYFFRSEASALSGTIDITIIDIDGLCFPPETVNLSAFEKNVKLSDVVISCADTAYINNFNELDPILSKIIIKPAWDGNSTALVLINTSGVTIREASGKVIQDKKYIWTNNTRLVIRTSEYGIRVELKYKINK